MELLLMIFLPVPLGYFFRSRLASYVAYVGAHSFVFTFQSLSLLRLWVGGDTAAFDKDPQAAPWPYMVVNLAIYAVGLSLVALGHRLGRRRREGRAARSEAVNLAA